MCEVTRITTSDGVTMEWDPQDSAPSHGSTTDPCTKIKGSINKIFLNVFSYAVFRLTSIFYNLP